MKRCAGYRRWPGFSRFRQRLNPTAGFPRMAPTFVGAPYAEAHGSSRRPRRGRCRHLEARFLLVDPLVGLAAGFVFAILKIALIVGAILFVVWFLKKKGGEEKADGATGG